MNYLFDLNWAELFVPQLSLLEIFIRGTVVYFALLALMRVTPKWQAGTGSVASLLFVVMLGGLAGDAIKGKADTLTDLLLMVATVLLWGIVVDRLAYRFPGFHFLAEDPPTCLVRNGRVLWNNLRRESISEEDLKAQLRRQGIAHIRRVREAYLEPDGSISVVEWDRDDEGGDGTSPPRTHGD